MEPEFWALMICGIPVAILNCVLILHFVGIL